jgi:hypothetical protein
MRYIPDTGRQHAAQLLFDLLVSQPLGALFGHDDQVNGRQLRAMTAEKFPEQTFHPIPLHSFAQALGHHQPQSGAGRGRGRQGHAEMTRIKPFTPGLGPKEVAAMAEPV